MGLSYHGFHLPWVQNKGIQTLKLMFHYSCVSFRSVYFHVRWNTWTQSYKEKDFPFEVSGHWLASSVQNKFNMSQIQQFNVQTLLTNRGAAFCKMTMIGAVRQICCKWITFKLISFRYYWPKYECYRFMLVTIWLQKGNLEWILCTSMLLRNFNKLSPSTAIYCPTSLLQVCVTGEKCSK